MNDDTYQEEDDDDTSEDNGHKHHDHEHDHDAEHEHDFDEDHSDDSSEEEDKKKKRAVKKKRSNLEVVKEDQIIPGDLTDFKKKKSIQWSKYFGIDRRKKSIGYLNNRYSNIMKKQSYDDYQPHNFKNHDDIPLHNFKVHDEPNNDEQMKKDQEQLRTMNDKLKTIEDLIIDETVKYTGAHESLTNPDDIRRLKDYVLSRLATAYSLEKMRRALEKFQESFEAEEHLQNNNIQGVKDDNTKRIAIKKEKVEFDNNE